MFSRNVVFVIDRFGGTLGDTSAAVDAQIGIDEL